MAVVYTPITFMGDLVWFLVNGRQEATHLIVHKEGEYKVISAIHPYFDSSTIMGVAYSSAQEMMRRGIEEDGLYSPCLPLGPLFTLYDESRFDNYVSGNIVGQDWWKPDSHTFRSTILPKLYRVPQIATVPWSFKISLCEGKITLYSDDKTEAAFFWSIIND